MKTKLLICAMILLSGCKAKKTAITTEQSKSESTVKTEVVSEVKDSTKLSIVKSDSLWNDITRTEERFDTLGRLVSRTTVISASGAKKRAQISAESGHGEKTVAKQDKQAKQQANKDVRTEVKTESKSLETAVWIVFCLLVLVGVLGFAGKYVINRT